ncbi:hypothetical protein BP5796_11820 [Coleophoma crateriformis]|uniref:Uncharacterized protein n=1 Tax=Coleophoma crateriformis TaxID=565419 RepID=A0A3D8QFL6_9HELO|nr:hypothetical protein BP5796_11820 [Coleophoma crateriformis]
MSTDSLAAFRTTGLRSDLQKLANEHFQHDLTENDRALVAAAATKPSQHAMIGSLLGLGLGLALASRVRSNRTKMFAAFRAMERPTQVKFADGRLERADANSTGRGGMKSRYPRCHTVLATERGRGWGDVWVLRRRGVVSRGGDGLVDGLGLGEEDARSSGPRGQEAGGECVAGVPGGCTAEGAGGAGGEGGEGRSWDAVVLLRREKFGEGRAMNAECMTWSSQS